MHRRTKIVTTIGPASSDESMLAQLIEHGTNVVRFNLAHNTPERLAAHIERVRAISSSLHKSIGIWVELTSAHLQLASPNRPTLDVIAGDTIYLTDDDSASAYHFACDLDVILPHIRIDDTLFLDRGRIRLTVIRVDKTLIACTVTSKGYIHGNESLHRMGGGLNYSKPSAQLEQELAACVAVNADFIALPNVTNADEVLQAKKLVQSADIQVLAKIERAEAVANEDTLQAIIAASDGVIVSRRDLSTEVGDAELIGHQKLIIQRARLLNKCVVTATEMMASMQHNPYPTRAEVFDCANAVLDGTDAVMCSAETATGEFPLETLQAMHNACIGAEKQPAAKTSTHRMDEAFTRTDEAIAMSVMYAANHLKGVKAIICLTESGSTPLWMSRIRSGLPIFAYTRHAKAARRVSLYRGVEAIPFDVTKHPNQQVNHLAVDVLRQRGTVRDGDLVILSKGDFMGVHGGTNGMQILSVGSIL
ncbi:pyruvate kinase [Salinibius halmophilus]|uniref:pyruvate kinase n=1 Tax=Salinibius halmophilus TaxID=1853216 RepID=UPI000E6693CC|nr:pyruvate kinase [Salinibius halmophilus]